MSRRFRARALAGSSKSKIPSAIDRISQQAHAVTLEFAFEFEAEFLHDPRRSSVRRPRNGNDSLQPYSLEGIAQRDAGGFGRQATPPAPAREPPSDFRVRGVAPKAHATEADHLLCRLIKEL